MDWDKYERKTLLRIVTSGSVDDGKSTLIGRLLYETNCIFEDQYAAVKSTSKKRGQERVDLSLLLDGLAAEREQGITIDVAYRYFATEKRKFIIADCPGHEQYTRNMVTGASTAGLALILIDARNGVLTQSKRHGFIVSLLQTPHMVVCINKMDLVGYKKEVFEKIVYEYTEFSRKLDIQDIAFIPLSALNGDNVTTRSDKMAWYDGQTLLHLIENVHVSSDKNLVDFRFPVQSVIRPNLDFRGFSGTIQSGTISPGEEIATLPSGKKSRIAQIITYDGTLREAYAGQAVTLTLEDEIDISRGDMIVRTKNLSTVTNAFEAMICWMDDEPMVKDSQYILKHTTQKVKAFITNIDYSVDVNSLHRLKTESFKLNDIGRVAIKTSQPLFFDNYTSNRATGSFILIDSVTNKTVASGMIRGLIKDLSDVANVKIDVSKKSSDVVWEGSFIPRIDWERRNGHKGAVLWFTGLSGSGKSTIAKMVIQDLFNKGCQVVMLDGDNIRHGLCGDLGFSELDRHENIRRVAEVAHLFYEKGNIVICTFISPFVADRDFARSMIPDKRFFEIFVKCDLSICKRRDPKGLYKKAQECKIKDFTGISSPYEEPDNCDILIETDIDTVRDGVERIKKHLNNRQILPE